jgi:hypothetical protein
VLLECGRWPAARTGALLRLQGRGGRWTVDGGASQPGQVGSTNPAPRWRLGLPSAVVTDPHASLEQAEAAARRASADRNLELLTALASAPRGLFLAAIAAPTLGRTELKFPHEGARAAAIAGMPGSTVWAWPASAPPEEVARDLAVLLGALGEEARAVLVRRPEARVIAPPIHGEVGAVVEGADATALVVAAQAPAAGELARGPDVPWTPEAEALASAGGFRPHTP